MKRKTKQRILGEILFFVFALVAAFFFMVWHEEYVDSNGSLGDDIAMLILGFSVIYVVRVLYEYVRLRLSKEEDS